MSEFVTWYDSSETGAPTLNNADGSMIAVLDACLVNGFNNKAITNLTVTGGVAVATCASHGYSGKYSQDVLIEGVISPAALNGKKQLTYIDTNTFRFAAPGVADGTATGTVTAKRAPLGWVKQFSGVNKAIYKRSDPMATSIMLRVVDTAAAPSAKAYCRVQMVESATDVDTFTGATPDSTQIADGYGQYWNKGTDNATRKQWTLIGDSKFLFFNSQDGSYVMPYAANAQGQVPMWFGDCVSYKAGDAYNTMLSGPHIAHSGAVVWSIYGLSQGAIAPSNIASNGSCVLARPHNQLPGSAVAQALSNWGAMSGYISSGHLYPSVIDGGASISMRPQMMESTINNATPVGFRGCIPGYGAIVSMRPFAHLTLLDSLPSFPGRTLLVVAEGGYSTGQHVIDITGPWL